MEYEPLGGIYRQGERARYRMVYVDEQHVETAQLYAVAGGYYHLFGVVYAVFAQFVVDQREREFGADDGRLYFAQKVGHAAYVVLVSVR